MPKFQLFSVNMLETSRDYGKSSRGGWSLGMALKLELLQVATADGHKEEQLNGQVL